MPAPQRAHAHSTAIHAPRPQQLALAISAICLALPAWAANADADAGPVMQTVEVIGTTPLAGATLARDQVAAHVQHLDRSDLAAPASANLPDALNRKLASVTINEVQGNPYQPDLSFRGYTASPLLGTPQGLAVYLDGVRMNQPFGDVVSWDLIPHNAIATLDLLPGSDPLFGLNALGGALALRSKDGRHDAGSTLQLQAGRYGRKELAYEHGGHNDAGWHWYTAANGYKEDGWRVASPTRLGQWFGKLGWADRATDISLSSAVSSSSLTGNGLQEVRLLERDYASVYTRPDQTHNHGLLLNLQASHRVSQQLQLAANAYYRRLHSDTLNGDMNDDALDQSVYQPNAAEQAALAAAGYTGYPAKGATAANTPFPYWRCVANVLRKDEPAEKCNGLLNRSASQQHNAGFSAQATVSGDWAGMPQQFTAGMALDTSHTEFRQSSQFGYLNPDRSITPVDFYADGSEIDDDGKPVDARVDLAGRTRTASLYASQTLSLYPTLHLTLSGRYNRTSVHNRDHLTPGGAAGSLDGDHRFSRFNPALGVSWDMAPAAHFYARVSESSRTPTAIELGCADPANPCKLPNAMAGDPPLRQVVTRTQEAGLRGTLARGIDWNASLFSASNRDDIQFVADDSAGYGYFRNVGNTRRRGLELALSGKSTQLDWSAGYTYLDATFRSSEVLGGAANSSANADGNITIRSGDRLPLIARHNFKASAEWHASAAWTLEAGMRAVSSANARGNENGQHQPDGVHYLGSGRMAGYALFDLSASYAASTQWQWFAHVSNLFDRRYATAAQLNATGLTAAGNFIARPFSASGDNQSVVHSTFYGPGAPRTIVLGVRYSYGR
ncbi:TonB-dependent receptor [Pseudoduganella sp. FT93W]|uniref:TonB-dependent receptor n=1 Tax=Duganella fentianensis TaxID=2692177 RepID=A0A845HRT6_9BURK|nr:TonB-dependent receptor [Duganella fentianensis]MYN44174.1 TonB-dependent receptor [Duganella fentianensis]